MADEQKLKYTVEVGKTGTGGKDAAKELQEVGVAADKSSKLVAGAARAFAGAFAASQVIQFARDSIRAFVEQENATRRLDGTLIALGRSSAQTSHALKQLAESAALPPGASRNSVLDAITELVRNGAANSDIPQLTQHVLDLAAAGYSVERAADAMGNAVSGDFGKLSKILNVDFPAAAGRARNLADALGLVQQRFGGLAVASAGGLGAQLTQWNQAVEQLKTGVGQILLTGTEDIVKFWAEQISRLSKTIHGGDAAPHVRPSWAPGGPLNGAAAPAEDPRAKLDPAFAAQFLRDAEFDTTISAARDPAARIGLSPTDADPAIMQQKRLEALQRVFSAGLILEEQYERERTELTKRGELDRATLAFAGAQTLMEANSQMLGASAAAQDQISRDYTQRSVLVRAYIAELAATAPTEEKAIERLAIGADALRRMGEQAEIARFAATDLGRELQQVGQQGVQAFAGGISNAMVQAFRTGKMEFRSFAADFLGQISQMIMQALVLAAIKRALSGTGAGAFLGFAQGGFAPRMAAAGAISGVQSVSSATYYPSFNTVAGEAGSEVLAVLSRPRFMQIGGLASYVGSVQGSELAMTNARDLQAAVNGRGGSVGGRIVVQVQGTKDFEVRLVDASVRGAVVEVVNGLHTDGEISSAVKGLTA